MFSDNLSDSSYCTYILKIILVLQSHLPQGCFREAFSYNFKDRILLLTPWYYGLLRAFTLLFPIVFFPLPSISFSVLIFSNRFPHFPASSILAHLTFFFLPIYFQIIFITTVFLFNLISCPIYLKFSPFFLNMFLHRWEDFS